MEDPVTSFDAVPRIVVIGDVHGDIGRLVNVLKALGVIDTNPELRWTAEPKNTIVIQLGDQLDNASRVGLSGTGWEKSPDFEVMLFMERLNNVARIVGGRVISLIGNHELMNITGDFTYVSKDSVAAAGGTDLRAARFRPRGSWANILARRPVVVRIGSNIFCHGGLLPEHIIACKTDIHKINTTMQHMLRFGYVFNEEEAEIVKTCLFSDKGILWTREYMNFLMAGKEHGVIEILNPVLRSVNASAMFIGHCTVDHITPTCNGKLWLVDAQFSRAYGSQECQVLEIIDDTTYRVATIRDT